MSVIYKNKKTISFVKGSPDVLLGLCTKKMDGDKVVDFTPEEKEKMRETILALTEKVAALTVKVEFLQKDNN